MIAFLDTSVVLRKLFNEPGQLREWRAIKTAYASRLMPLEVGRVIDRYRLQGKINDEEVASLNEEFNRVRRSLEIVARGESILNKAGGALPTLIGALDAIHLVSALEVKARLKAPGVVLATHDGQLGLAARACGLTVIGLKSA